jgi:hypothetical protein
MKGLSTSWKFFRIICICQLVMVAFQGMFTISRLLSGKIILVNMLELIVYCAIFVFVYQGLSILNYNYPNIPLSVKQKRSFNILYLVNFLFIAILFARVVNIWEDVVSLIVDAGNLRIYSWFFVIVVYLFPWLIFIIHLVFLAGMFKLRRLIHENTINSWYEQFDKKAE